ncbi:HD family phosphohydrolase [Oceanirhabdus sp. W0125-5]|uniref:HD family phosphohydrolase n=1 Tax=Oceanirhabdus sp. W0125-5 TaxID=2999116 RepID=UPI0022F2DB5E|nr:HDIG domain-containing metalloprotein [Oceanirhabdus sp. W0125-5]WBW95771.1 HDIG domain-containing protein [Oceanirhabdus sp. W0125-5]
MSKSFFNNILNKDNTKKGIILLVTIIATFLVLLTSLGPQKYNLRVGSISDVSIKAPYDVTDEITTEKLREKTAAEVKDVTSYKTNVKMETSQSIEDLFSKVIEVNRDVKLTEMQIQKIEQSSGDFEEALIYQKLQQLKNISLVKLSDEDFTLLLNLSPKVSNDLKIFIIDLMNNLYETANINEIKDEQTGKTMIKPDDLVNAERNIESYFNKSTFSKSVKELGKSISYLMVRANLVYDAKKTELLRQQAREDVMPIKVRKGQYIIEDGDVVTEAQIAILKELNLLSGSGGTGGLSYISIAVMVIIIIAAQWIYIYRFEKEVFFNNKLLILISVINIISLVLCRSIVLISPFIIPVAFAPMLLALLIKHNIAITISVINSAFIITAAGLDISMSIVVFISAVLGATLLKNMEQRNDILFTAFLIGIINSFLIGGMQLINQNFDIITILANCLFVFLGALIAGILSIGFLPFLESIFDIVTNVKLLELSNPNHPLLKKLLMEAPGTYNHSVLVGNLCEMAAQAVGANSIIARVGAFYHDIGKIKRPYFFKENQRGENPHDNITPNLSTLIITSHVKDGVELAKEYKLPMAIKDIIEQHHGVSLVKYFYITMKNTSDNPDEVKEEDFRYPGPIPSSKEAAIVMLADGVEAAVRSINNPTKEKIEEMVSNIIKGRLNDGQLDNCDLTLKDLTKIKEAFLKGLGGIYHQRIEYPKLVNNKTNEKGEELKK